MSRRFARIGLLLLMPISLLTGCLPGQLTGDWMSSSTSKVVSSESERNGKSLLAEARPLTAPPPIESVAETLAMAQRTPAAPVAQVAPVAPVVPEVIVAPPMPTLSSANPTIPEKTPLMVSPPPAAAEAVPTKPAAGGEADLLSLLRNLRGPGGEETLQRSLARIDPARQAMLRKLLAMSARLSESNSSSPPNNEELAELLQQLEGTAAHLRQLAPLKITKACFCRKRPLAFGAYDPLPGQPRFQAGSDGKPGELVHLYLEVRNFVSRDSGDQTFQTALGAWIEFKSLFTSGNIERIDLQTRYDRSLTARQDYYIWIAFHIPPRLAPGTYELLAGVRDELGLDPTTGKPRVALNQQLSFQVVGSGGPGSDSQLNPPR